MKYIAFVTLLLISQLVSPQNIDELIKKAEKENTAKSWNDLAEYYREEGDTTNLITCINESHKLAIIAKNNQEIGRAFMYWGDYEHLRKHRYDSIFLDMKTKAVEYMKLHDNTPYLTEAYYDLSRYYNISGEFDIAIQYLKLSVNVLTEKNVRGSAPAYCDMAYSYLYLGKLDSVQFYAQEAISTAYIKKDTVSLCTGYSYLGIASSKRNNFTKAIEYFFKVSDIYQKQQNWKRQVTTLCNISSLYYDFEKYDKAIEIGKKGLDIVNKHNLPNIYKAKVLYTIAAPLHLEKNYAEAIEYYKQALPVILEQDHIRAWLSGLAESYYRINMPDSSNYYFDKLEALYAKNNAVQSSKYYNDKGRRAFFNDNYKEAAYFWEKAVEKLNRPSGFSLRETASFYSNISIAYEKGVGDYKTALFYKNKALMLQDSIFQNKYNNSLSEFYAQFQTAEKDLLISQQNEREQEILYNRALIIGGFIIVAILLILALFYNRLLRLKKEKESVLLTARIEQKEIEYKNLINETESRLVRRYLEGRETEKKSLAKELHDSVANEIMTVIMQNQSDTNHENVNNLLKNTYNHIRQISHQLMPPEFKYISLSDMIGNYTEVLNETTGVNFEFIINERDVEKTDELSKELSKELYCIIQESISNILKHADATNVSIDLSIDNSNQLTLNIIDDGNGFDTNAKYEGIGLRTMKDRCMDIVATLNIASRIGTGTKIAITLPVDLKQHHPSLYS